MDPIDLTLRGSRLPPASEPVGGELSAAEVDANFEALRTAAEQLNTEKAPATHTHAIANITGLRTELDLIWQAIADAAAVPITARLASLASTDDTIYLREGTPYLVDVATQADAFGASPPAATEPGAFTVGMWDAQPTATPGEIAFSVDSLPSSGGSPITTLQYRVGTGAAIALVGVGTGERIVTAGFTAGLAADSQLRAVNAVGAGAWSDVKTRTPAAAGGGTADYRSATYTAATAASTTIARPAGAVAGDTLVAIMFGNGSAAPATAAAPAGWTAGTGITPDGKGARVFTAPGDVASLAFNSTGATGIVCFAVSGALRAGSGFEGYYWENGSATDVPTPSVATQAGDCVVSAYIQIDNGTGGVLVGPIQSGYTQRLSQNVAATPPYISIISRAGVAAGASGTVSHGGNGGFSTRFCFTGAFA